MTVFHPGPQRGRNDLGWLQSWHSFSFGDFRDPQRMGFRVLRVINDDRVAPNTGFPMHPHRDMEIVSFVVSGRIAHRDSMGSEGSLGRFEVQAMTAGRGVTHSEFNPSASEELRLLQIWMFPREHGLDPAYSQAAFDIEGQAGSLVPLVSPDGRGGSLTIQQDATMYAVSLRPGDEVVLPLAAGRAAWVQAVEGSLEALGTAMGDGDGLAVEDEPEVALRAAIPALALVFDLP